MTVLSEKLNFSNAQGSGAAIEVSKYSDVNHYDTLCLYCAENNVDLSTVLDEDFDACADLMADYGQQDKTTDSYFFWIDEA